VGLRDCLLILGKEDSSVLSGIEPQFNDLLPRKLIGIPTELFRLQGTRYVSFCVCVCVFYRRSAVRNDMLNFYFASCQKKTGT
jgi:hypothetical protein